MATKYPIVNRYLIATWFSLLEGVCVCACACTSMRVCTHEHVCVLLFVVKWNGGKTSKREGEGVKLNFRAKTGINCWWIFVTEYLWYFFQWNTIIHGRPGPEKTQLLMGTDESDFASFCSPYFEVLNHYLDHCSTFK